MRNFDIAGHPQLLQQRDDIRQKIDEGWDAARRGEFVDGDELFDRIDRELTSLQPHSQK
jgi:predicted transcriptional regulator